MLPKAKAVVHSQIFSKSVPKSVGKMFVEGCMVGFKKIYSVRHGKWWKPPFLAFLVTQTHRKRFLVVGWSCAAAIEGFLSGGDDGLVIVEVIEMEDWIREENLSNTVKLPVNRSYVTCEQTRSWQSIRTKQHQLLSLSFSLAFFSFFSLYIVFSQKNINPP